MSSASVEDHRTNLELKDVGTPETSFCRALADLKKFTCEQRQLCEADLERLQSRVATVLRKDASCATSHAPSALWRRHVCSFTKFRARVRERTLRYGLGQHQYLSKQFDGDSIFGVEGKAMMATKYKQWRIMAVVLTRWQMYTVRPATCLNEQL
ncbi:hypothetical protein WJX79_007571 [Trebouxia sp. C0005]